MNPVNTTGAIVCATRGGKASYLLQARATQLARAEQKALVFVYIVNTENLGEMSKKMTGAAREELTWFGNALLKVAQARARRAGVEAEILLREGGVREQIENVLREKNADLLVLGASREQHSEPLFAPDALTQFARRVEEATGVEVRILTLDETE